MELLNSEQSSGSGKETLNTDAVLGFTAVIFWVELFCGVMDATSAFLVRVVRIVAEVVVA